MHILTFGVYLKQMNKNFISFLLMGILPMFSSCGQNAEPTNYYFPQGFKGEFIIIYGEKNGCPEKHEGGRRQLFIPQSGVLITQFEFSDGFRDDIFFIQNDKGDYLSIKEYVTDHSIKKQIEKDTSKLSIENSSLIIVRGERIEIFNKKKEVRVVETGSLKNNGEENYNNKSSQDFIDSVLKQIEVNDVEIKCR